jgi:hypothetical protein
VCEPFTPPEGQTQMHKETGKVPLMKQTQGILVTRWKQGLLSLAILNLGMSSFGGVACIATLENILSSWWHRTERGLDD